jgi:hypothetical protein
MSDQIASERAGDPAWESGQQVVTTLSASVLRAARTAIQRAITTG